MSQTSTSTTGRLSAIDFTRGLVIVIMALDHIRDLLHTTSLTQQPLDLATTTPALFMTRWITHFCAPVFIFLAGVSAYLMSRRQNNVSETRRFLFTRGLWLIFLEITIIGFAIWFDLKFRSVLFQVIFAIGSGFVILSALVKLPSKIIGFMGLAIVLLHGVLPLHPFAKGSAGAVVWAIFFEGGFFNLGSDRALIIIYSIIPWLGILLCGFGFAKVFERDAPSRRKILLRSGLSCLLVFIILRIINLYGDPKPWSPQVSFLYSLLSFINLSKYPPSLVYTAMTLSVMFFVLCIAEGKNNRLTGFFITYGRVPMFFYVLHWYIIHISMFVMIILQGVTWEQMPFGPWNFGRPKEGVGLELPYVYVYWICLIICMYPLCRWYGKYKAANGQKKWLGYL